MERKLASVQKIWKIEPIEGARGKYASGNDKEGIVIRPQEPIYSSITEGPLSMKVINNDFLLM